MTTDTAGGVWNYCVTLCSGLLSNGADIYLVALSASQDAEHLAQVERLRSAYPHKFIFTTASFPLEWMRDNARLAESMTFLLELIRSYQPDILHSNQFCYGALPTSVPKVVVAHSDVVSWWWATHRCEPPDDEWSVTYRRVLEHGLGGATCVVSPSEWQLSLLRSHYRWPDQNSIVIHNGAACRAQSSPRQMQAISAGRGWDKGKNLKLLGEAGLPVPILIAGQMNPGEVAANKNDAFRYLGQVQQSRLHELMTESAIFVAPSLYEPFGLAVLEAAHCGCALILSDIGSFRELWQDDALFFSPFDPLSLLEAVEKLVSSSELCVEMGNRARVRAQRSYGEDRFTASYIHLYRTLKASRGLNHAA